MPNNYKSPCFPRGSEWRQWDLHIHTPASFHWNDGKRFKQMDSEEKKIAVDRMIEAMNSSTPDVFAIMDYWNFDGWLALQERLAQDDSPKLTKKVFPGIELRLISPTTYRLNAHVLFSDEITTQELLDFKSKLTVGIVEKPLSDECLITLARTAGEDRLRKVQCTKAQTIDDDSALIIGSKIAEITAESYIAAFESVPNSKAIGFMPWSTSDGMAGIKWDEHYAYSSKLLNALKVFETRDSDEWAAFVGIKTDSNGKYFENFQNALSKVPRLPVAGSDAHRFTSKNDERGYGDFPSGKVTWIKADPTFLGLLQAIKEPEKRSFIGERPDKLLEVEKNKTFFISNVTIKKHDGASFTEKWLDDCNIPFNSDLVAIIGNKGSGKSALADVIALLGNSKQKKHFSFLSDKRFCAKPKEFAKSFTGEITWTGQSKSQSCLLSQNPESTSVELVRYIPQAHFETLCNDHASGESDVFEKELRSVIFSHTSIAIRQKALDFDQFIDQQERSLRDQLSEYRKDLNKVNQEIEAIEAQLQPEVKRHLQALLDTKKNQILEHRKIMPVAIVKPSELLSAEQQQSLADLEDIKTRLDTIEETVKILTDSENTLAGKSRAVRNVQERLFVLKKQYTQFQEDIDNDLLTLGLTISHISSLSTPDDSLNAIMSTLPNERAEIERSILAIKEEKKSLLEKQSILKKGLDEPNQAYQANLKAIDEWNKKLQEMTGSQEIPDTLKGIETRIEQLDSLPSLLAEKSAKRILLSGNIFDVLDAQSKSRADLFKPVQDVIKNNSLIRDDYKLQFQSHLVGHPTTLASRLFVIIKQSSGDFRGEEESHATVKKIAEQFDFNNKAEALEFINQLHQEIKKASKEGSNGFGIKSALRINQTSTAAYDLIFGLTFLDPRYSLLFQDAQIEQLSPGQRGALLLIFYLLVDQGHNPIVLDQPEENLDNETVVSLLVPVLNSAKKKRQIIMVTHNPNLAVVCDAEQVIYSSFDRKNDSKIEYFSGSIENLEINTHVVNVLEGTKRAFDNRKEKYQ